MPDNFQVKSIKLYQIIIIYYIIYKIKTLTDELPSKITKQHKSSDPIDSRTYHNKLW